MSSNISSTVLNSIIKDYSKSFSGKPKDTIFEYFAIENFFKEMNLDLEDIESGLSDSSEDWGVDALYLFINKEIIKSLDINDLSIGNLNKEFELDVHIFQIKNKSKIEESVPQKFSQFAPYLFGSKDLKLPESMSETLKDRISFFRKLVVKGASKYPKINIYFHHVTLAEKSQISQGYKEKTETTFKTLEQNTITDLSLNHDVIDREDLFRLAKKTIPRSGDLLLNSNPIIPTKITTAAGYLGTAYLKDFFKFISIKKSEDDTWILNEEMFESNIRDYQNRSIVNNSIEKSIKSKSTKVDFWWLNNGITIIANKGTLTMTTMHLENVQIVNGLQTSNSIFNVLKNWSEEELKEDSRSVFIKIIILNDTDTTKDDIIRATNSQNPVSASQLRSSDPLQRDIELFLKTKGLFYDRKKNYYRNQGKPVAKIFSINYLSQALVSILESNPVKARSNPTTLIKTDEKYDKVFNNSYDINVFYYALLIRIKVSEYLKDIRRNANNDPVKENIAKYYDLHVTRALASLLVNTVKVTDKNLLSLDASQITKTPIEVLSQAMNIVKLAIDNSSEDTSKKTELNQKITDQLNFYFNN